MITARTQGRNGGTEHLGGPSDGDAEHRRSDGNIKLSNDLVTRETAPTKEAAQLAHDVVNLWNESEEVSEEECDRLIELVAPALDAYAAQRVAEAIERCAQVAHNSGRYSERYLDGDIPQDVVTHNRICWSIRDGIRSLKEPRR